jgi:AcrR family transcriptional regulator
LNKRGEVVEVVKERILDAALVEFALRGYEGATIRSIANRAKVNVAMISYYFRGKKGLYKAVLERHLDEFVSSLDNIPSDGIEGIKFFVRKHVEVLRKRGPLTSLVVMREIVFPSDTFLELKKNFYEVIVDKLSRVIRDAMDKGYIRALDLNFVAQFLIHLDFWFSFKFAELDEAILAERILEVFLKGVGS